MLRCAAIEARSSPAWASVDAGAELQRLGDETDKEVLSPWIEIPKKAEETKNKVRELIALFAQGGDKIAEAQARAVIDKVSQAVTFAINKEDEQLAVLQERAAQAINAIGSKESSGLGSPKAIIPNLGKQEVFTDDLAKKLHNLQTINEGLTTSFDNLFSGLASGTRSISQLFTGMADTIVAALGKIIAKMLVMALMERLAGLLTGAVANTNIGANGPSNLEGGGLGSGGGSRFSLRRASADQLHRACGGRNSHAEYALLGRRKGA
jgi:hypothetical protein